MATFVSGVSLFDPTAYLALNADVKAAAGSLSGQALNDFAFNHFLNFGAAEGRDPLGMVTTSSVPNTLTKGNITGDVGGNGVAGGGVFDAAYYLTINTDVNAAAITAANGLAASGKVVPSNFFAAFALTHFVQFGAVEGRAPSAAFDQAAYRSAQSDVSAAIVLHQTTSIQHYLQFGEKEGRAAPAVAGAVQGGGVAGSSFTLTTGVDNITGTSGNDTITADNTNTAKQLSVADQIGGGAGSDTLKIFLNSADTVTGSPTLSSIETLYLNSGNIRTLDLSTSTYTGVTALQVDSQIMNDAGTAGGAAAGAVTYTLNGQSVLLTNSVQDNNATTVTNGTDTTTLASATDTSESVTVNNYVTVAAGTTNGVTATQTLDLAGANVATLSVTATGATSSFILTNSGTALKTVNISGSKTLTLTESLTGVVTINASTDTATLTVDKSGANAKNTFAFTGGSGADTLILAAGDLTRLTAGSQLDGGAGSSDTLTIKDTAPATTDYTAMNATKNFEILGLGVTGITIDASSITGALASHMAVSGTSFSETINNVSNGFILDISGTTPGTDVITPLVGQQSATVNLNTSATKGGITVTALTVTGLGSPTVVATGSSADVITTYTVSANSGSIFSGADGLTVTNWVGGASGDALDATALTGTLVLGTSVAGANTATNFGTSGKGDVLKFGSGTTTVAEKASTTGNTITFLSGHTKVDTLDVSATTAANLAGHLVTSVALATTDTDKITNFVIGSSASSTGDVLKLSFAAATAAAGSITDMNGTGSSGGWANAGAGFVTKSGATVTSFLTDVTALSGVTAGHTVAFNDGSNTWIAEFAGTTRGDVHIIELIGTTAATALATTGAANTILIS